MRHPINFIRKQDQMNINNIDHMKTIHEYAQKISDLTKPKFGADEESPILIPNQHKMLFRCIENLPGYSHSSVEILAGKVDAFKPFNVEIKATNIDGETKYVEILNVTVMGNPQLLNFDGVTYSQNRGSSKIFENGLPVTWQTFGGSSGQGLHFTFRNPNDCDVNISVLITGSENDSTLIGRDFHEIRQNIIFARGECNKKDKLKLNVLAGRAGKSTPTKMSIIVLDEKSRQLNIDLCDIKLRNNASMLPGYSSIPTNFLDPLRGCDFGTIGSSANQGLIFEFENPTDHNAMVYVTLIEEKRPA